MSAQVGSRGGELVKANWEANTGDDLRSVVTWQPLSTPSRPYWNPPKDPLAGAPPLPSPSTCVDFWEFTDLSPSLLPGTVATILEDFYEDRLRYEQWAQWAQTHMQEEEHMRHLRALRQASEKEKGKDQHRLAAAETLEAQLKERESKLKQKEAETKNIDDICLVIKSFGAKVDTALGEMQNLVKGHATATRAFEKWEKKHCVPELRLVELTKRFEKARDDLRNEHTQRMNLVAQREKDVEAARLANQKEIDNHKNATISLQLERKAFSVEQEDWHRHKELEKIKPEMLTEAKTFCYTIVKEEKEGLIDKLVNDAYEIAENAANDTSFNDGYEEGHKAGYEEGNTTGIEQGKNDALAQHQTDSYEAGFQHSKHEHFQEGISAGFQKGETKGRKGGLKEGRRTGFKDGKAAGFQEGWDGGRQEGWDEGHDEGWEEGHNEGWEEGNKEGYDDGYNRGHKQGKADGKDIGYQRAKEATRKQLLGHEMLGYHEAMLTMTPKNLDHSLEPLYHSDGWSNSRHPYWKGKTNGEFIRDNRLTRDRDSPWYGLNDEEHESHLLLHLDASRSLHYFRGICHGYYNHRENEPQERRGR
ncbi:hypothetical protein BDV95DRAFT_614410 [Massariosphaeria phaeospora]|uniref:Uncharacterized protein n=1 Tax=Massariosphaeria phaeospora TaxID=100035 RepID=A0A7C8MFH8_9PLEO|nr:hypothetical protein BDV95DRAFT_614410 [Massariosphaeria phaeospora]